MRTLSTIFHLPLLRKSSRFLGPVLLTVALAGPSRAEPAGVTDEELTSVLAEIDSALEEVDWMLSQVEGTGATPPGTVPVAPPRPPSPLLWSGRLAISLGAEDNVLLSADLPMHSAFVRTSADFSLNYTRTGWGEFSLLGLYEGREFVQVGLHGETLVLGEAGWSGQRGRWTASGATRFLYSEYVFDATESDGAERVEGIVRERSPELEFGLTRDLGSSGWVRLEGTGGLSRFGGTSDDYDSAGIRLLGGWVVSPRLTVRPWVGLQQRRYLAAKSKNAQGFWLPDEDGGTTLLRTTAADLGIWTRLRFGADWTLSIPLAWEVTAAENGDYYDRQRLYARARMTWSPGPWEISLEGLILRIEYDARTVGIVDPAVQWQEKQSVSVELRRELRRHAEIFTLLQRSFVDSNKPALEYATWSAELGFNFEF